MPTLDPIQGVVYLYFQINLGYLFLLLQFKKFLLSNLLKGTIYYFFNDYKVCRVSYSALLHIHYKCQHSSLNILGLWKMYKIIDIQKSQNLYI